MTEYIEREATIELLRSLGSRDYRREKGTIQDAIKMVSFSEYTPAADVTPVRHGRWITTSGEVFPGSSQFLCYSHKHEECGFQYVDMNENEYDYCPHCGAKMMEG